MLALLAIAFGKDMATATVISLEPFLEATQPSLNKQSQEALPPPPPPSHGVAPPATTATALGTGVGTADDADAGYAQGAVKDASPGASVTATAAAGTATSIKHGTYVEQVWLVRYVTIAPLIAEKIATSI